MLQFEFNSFNLSVFQNHEQNLSGIYNVEHDLMLRNFRFQKSIISKNKCSTYNSKDTLINLKLINQGFSS